MRHEHIITERLDLLHAQFRRRMGVKPSRLVYIFLPFRDRGLYRHQLDIYVGTVQGGALFGKGAYDDAVYTKGAGHARHFDASVGWKIGNRTIVDDVSIKGERFVENDSLHDQ